MFKKSIAALVAASVSLGTVAPTSAQEAPPTYTAIIQHLPETSSLMAYRVADYKDGSVVEAEGHSDFMAAYGSETFYEWLAEFTPAKDDAGLPTNALPVGVYVLLDKAGYCAPSLVVVDGKGTPEGSCKPVGLPAPAVKLVGDTNKVKAGDSVSYTITQLVPNYYGSDNPTLRITVTQHPDLKYANVTTVKVGDKTLPVTGYKVNTNGNLVLEVPLEGLPVGSQLEWSLQMKVANSVTGGSHLDLHPSSTFRALTQEGNTVSVQVEKVQTSTPAPEPKPEPTPTPVPTPPSKKRVCQAKHVVNWGKAAPWILIPVALVTTVFVVSKVLPKNAPGLPPLLQNLQASSSNGDEDNGTGGNNGQNRSGFNFQLPTINLPGLSPETQKLLSNILFGLFGVLFGAGIWFFGLKDALSSTQEDCREV